MARILVVDDDESILDAVSMLLEDRGYEVQTLTKGEDVLPKIKTFLPNLILMDHLMNGISGQEICLKLKKNKNAKNIPIVIISAHPAIKKIVLKSGAQDFLAKPFEMEDLVNKVIKYTTVNKLS